MNPQIDLVFAEVQLRTVSCMTIMNMVGFVVTAFINGTKVINGFKTP